MALEAFEWPSSLYPPLQPSAKSLGGVSLILVALGSVSQVCPQVVATTRHQPGRCIPNIIEYFKFSVRQVGALICTTPYMLQFLLDMLVKEKFPLALKGMIAHIKTALTGPHKLAHGYCTCIAQLAKSACSVTLCQKLLAVPPWDLEVVLMVLQHEPFEPLKTMELK